MGRTGSFRPIGDWKKAADSRFYQESARAKTENGNFFNLFEGRDLETAERFLD
jgi:hypothetical protein